MAAITVRELRNQGGQVIDRVVAGESLTVTRDGTAVAELRPLPRTPLPRETLVARWARLPTIDPDAMRRDIDSVLDPSI